MRRFDKRVTGYTTRLVFNGVVIHQTPQPAACTGGIWLVSDQWIDVNDNGQAVLQVLPAA